MAIKKSRLPKKEFDRIYGRVPRLTVEVLIKTQAGLLLTKRDIEPWQGQWHLPGGTVFFRESLKQAAKRIALEELGVSVILKKLLGPIEYFKSNLGPLHVVGLGCLCVITKGALKGSWQAKEFKFFKTRPKNIIPEQGNFLKKHKLVK